MFSSWIKIGWAKILQNQDYSNQYLHLMKSVRCLCIMAMCNILEHSMVTFVYCFAHWIPIMPAGFMLLVLFNQWLLQKIFQPSLHFIRCVKKRYSSQYCCPLRLYSYDISILRHNLRLLVRVLTESKHRILCVKCICLSVCTISLFYNCMSTIQEQPAVGVFIQYICRIVLWCTV